MKLYLAFSLNKRLNVLFFGGEQDDAVATHADTFAGALSLISVDLLFESTVNCFWPIFPVMGQSIELIS